MTRKPRPKFGWQGELPEQSGVILDGLTVGSRVYHEQEPGKFGTIVSGPHTRGGIGTSTFEVWQVKWDAHPYIYDHNCDTLKAEGT